MTLLRSRPKTEKNSPIRHTGDGRYPPQPWVPAATGTTESCVNEIQRRHTTAIRRAAPLPAEDRRCRSPRGTSRRPARAGLALRPAGPVRPTAGRGSLQRAIPATSLAGLARRGGLVGEMLEPRRVGFAPAARAHVCDEAPPAIPASRPPRCARNLRQALRVLRRESPAASAPGPADRGRTAAKAFRAFPARNLRVGWPRHQQARLGKFAPRPGRK